MKRISIALLTVVVATLAACDGGPLPGESVAAATEKAKAAGTAKVFISMEQQMPSGQGTLSMEGDGAFDFERQAGMLTLSMSGLGGAAGAPQMPPMDMEMVFEGFVMYMRLPTLQQVLPAGKTWVKLDLAKMSEQAGIDFEQLAQMGQNNPAQGLEYLQGATDIQELGSDEVRGVSTTHYSGVIDMDKLAEEADAAA
ncbi:MAG TPA: hypothetical protein VNP73_02915, partial [Actinomycetota bacterium]|nr:hypothetical protein [Actinomycetota bacterium]